MYLYSVRVSMLIVIAMMNIGVQKLIFMILNQYAALDRGQKFLHIVFVTTRAVPLALSSID